ncbi:hypothetical protein [Rhizobium bangladeshense]|uniref:hypothetical protein n=1 Tax=Rhizobium bangladeshense TaxID=1138189 RepID=UPI001C82CE70|nr:hypothetical protein [Rhizobium bangladeshense]MBX4899495.1 hypothetical protein [Rhizobium bangladeshense]MBY3617708.1 hypothetical protein [Rhizobium bangladeshense]
MAGFVEFVRDNIRKAFAAALAAGGLFGAVSGSAVTYYFTVQQTRVQRFESTMLTEYQAVATAKRQLYASIDALTAGLAKGKKPDPALVAEINKQVLELHQRVDLFSIGLPGADKEKVAAVKVALAGIKAELARAKAKEDLPFIAGQVVQFETAYKAVEPIVERQIGMPSEMLNG